MSAHGASNRIVELPPTGGVKDASDYLDDNTAADLVAFLNKTAEAGLSLPALAMEVSNG